MQSLTARRILRYAEYGLLALIIGLLALFLLNRVHTVHRHAERMSIIGEINSLRAGVVTMRDSPKNASIKDLSGMDPFRLVQDPPANYLGPVRNPEQRDISPGSWYYDANNDLLIYKARFAHNFPFTKAPTRELRLALDPPNQIPQDPQPNILACGMTICLTIR